MSNRKGYPSTLEQVRKPQGWAVVVYQRGCNPRRYKCHSRKTPSMQELQRWGANIHLPRRDEVKMTKIPAWLWTEFDAEWIRP